MCKPINRVYTSTLGRIKIKSIRSFEELTVRQIVKSCSLKYKTRKN